MFKKGFFLILIASIFLSGCVQKKDEIDLYESILQKDKIVVGTSFDSMPFGFKGNKGEVQGMEADLARELAKRILGNPNNVVFKDIAPQDRINAVESGDVDMVISTMTITPQRKRIVDFSVPYFIAGQAICVKKDSKIDSHFDLNNKRVVVILGTTAEKNILRFAPNALMQSYSNNTAALDAFREGQDDAITTDDALLQGFVMRNKDYIILPERLTKEPYGIAFKKTKHTKSLREHVNKILQEIRYNGTLESIKRKWEIK